MFNTLPAVCCMEEKPCNITKTDKELKNAKASQLTEFQQGTLIKRGPVLPPHLRWRFVHRVHWCDCPHRWHRGI